MPGAQQQIDPAAAGEGDLHALLERLTASVEATRRELVTPRSRNRARLILKELRALERDLGLGDAVAA